MCLMPYLLQKLGPVKLSAQVNWHAVPPETYRQPGSFVFARVIPAAGLSPDRVRVEFMLDKSLSVDARELGRRAVMTGRI
jgi:hypothetical protein